ncbi:MAG TPA: hypothetical protein VGW38_24610 [Chloroflexota bacterium]|nr:hypothetical protein [Chloroflexota bacterium]
MMGNREKLPQGRRVVPRRTWGWTPVCYLMLLLGALAATASASACVPQPLLSVQPHASAQPGSNVTVTGISFGTATAEIRWNGIEGPLLATAEGPDFSTEITIPDVPAGLYTVIGIARQAGGGLDGTAAISFQVTDFSEAGEPSSPGAAVTAAPAPNHRHTAPDGSTTLSLRTAAVGGTGILLIGGLMGAWVMRRQAHTQAHGPE